MESKTNIVLVHGAWAGGSSWGKVIPLLQQKAFNVTAAQIPLTSLADDIVVTRNLLAAQKGPTGFGVNPFVETVWNWHTCCSMVFPSQAFCSPSG